ncbi:MAG: acyl carrier protein [Alphaproteobacteria bacterium]|jgi:acyl carrier protein
MTSTPADHATSGGENVMGDIFDLLTPFNTQAIELTAATDINADLDVDSVVILDFLMTLEDKYDVSIPINLVADVRTVGELTAMVEQAINDRADSGSASGSV